MFEGIYEMKQEQQFKEFVERKKNEGCLCEFCLHKDLEFCFYCEFRQIEECLDMGKVWSYIKYNM